MQDIDKLVKPTDRKNIKKAPISFPPKLQEVFLEALRMHPTISAAAKACEIDPSTIYSYKRDNPEFQEKVALAREESLDKLEEVLFKRATEGVKKGIYHQGKKIDDEYSYSDQAAFFLLNGHRPQTFKRGTSVEVTGKDGGPIELSDVKSKLLSMLPEKVIEGEIIEEEGE